METYYEINVAKYSPKKGTFVHLFATAPRSCVTLGDLDVVYREIRGRFAAPEFKITVTYWQDNGVTVEMAPKG